MSTNHPASMKHEGFADGQLSPPMSHHDEQSQRRYGLTPEITHAEFAPYTPPRSQPGHGYSYDDPEHYEMAYDQGYYEQQPYHPAEGYRTPPLPVSEGRLTRSGRVLDTPTTATSSPASRTSASPRARRNRKGKEHNTQILLEQPLSIETKDYDVPVRDMMAWANRPHYERHQEVDKQHKGNIPRPLNSFMLYRQAYKERIKKWGEQGNNNQLISRVAGLSWNMEPQEVKEFYARVSVLERDNHGAAFPEYKFAPNKNLKKRGRNDDDDGSDTEWDGGSVYGGKRRRARDASETIRSRSATPAQPIHSSPRYHPSSLQATNPHLMAPEPHYAPWVQPVAYDQYYGYPTIPYHDIVQDLHYAPTSMPVTQDPYHMHLVGMPPMNDGMIETMPSEHAAYAVDPGLNDIGAQASYQYGTYPDMDSHEEYAREGEQMSHPGMHTLAAAEPMWSPNGPAVNAFDVELSHWHGES